MFENNSLTADSKVTSQDNSIKRRESSMRYRNKKRELERQMKEELSGLRAQIVVLKHINEQWKSENKKLRQRLAERETFCICTLIKTSAEASHPNGVITCCPIQGQGPEWEQLVY